MFATWGRISKRAVQPGAVLHVLLCLWRPSCYKPPDPGGVSSTAGCSLQIGQAGFACNLTLVGILFDTGQTKVPDIPQRMISLFLLPACVFQEWEQKCCVLNVFKARSWDTLQERETYGVLQYAIPKYAALDNVYLFSSKESGRSKEKFSVFPIVAKNQDINLQKSPFPHVYQDHGVYRQASI